LPVWSGWAHIHGMTPRNSRILIAVLSTVLVVSAMGCGLVSKAQSIANAVKILGEMGDRLKAANNLTYTAKYNVDGGDPVTVTQQPPNSAIIGTTGRFILTADSTFLCSTEEKVLTCQKSPSVGADAVGAQDASLVAGIAGQGFISPELALGLILAASIVPGAQVSQSNKTIAGQNSLCATASNLQAAASPGDTSDTLSDFTVCVADSGVLTSFSGSDTSGQHKGVTMTLYSATADASSFVPPPGAKIVDVTALAPTPS
jgi:hypothetical protein